MVPVLTDTEHPKPKTGQQAPVTRPALKELRITAQGNALGNRTAHL